jgi:hypothetical protein
MNHSPARTQSREPKAVVALLCSLFLVSSGCTTTRSFSSADAIQDDLRPGDDVTLVLTDGRELELSVTEVTSEQLNGLDRGGVAHSVPSGDIAHVDVTRISAMKTVLLLLSFASLALLVEVAGAYGGVWDGPPTF